MFEEACLAEELKLAFNWGNVMEILLLKKMMRQFKLLRNQIGENLQIMLISNPLK